MRSLENLRLREYRKQILAIYRSNFFKGIFEDIFEKVVDNFGSLVGSLVGVVNLLILTVVGIIWFIFAPIWIPLYICVRIVRKAYYRIHNIRFYNKCGSPFKMFENIKN